MERLEKKMKATPDSDITPEKDGGVLKQRKRVGEGPIIPEGAVVMGEFYYYFFCDF